MYRASIVLLGTLSLSACVPNIDNLIASEVDEIFAEADSNRDDKIDWEEFLASEEEGDDTPTREEFAEFDQDGDGFIVREEFSNWVKEKVAS